MPADRPFRLFYVEDNSADVLLVETALWECELNVRLTSVDDGDKALAYLRRRGVYNEAERPDLVLLDLNLPRVNGEEVLVTIKQDPALKAMPVVLFTSAANELVCRPIYQEYANTCVRKPATLEGFMNVVKTTCEYWFNVACLPKE